MSAIYRPVKRSEEPEAMQLWTSVFGVVAPFFQSLMDVQGDRRLNQTRVAIEDGKIVSALHVFYRNVRGLDGRVLKLGAIGSVATHDDYRKRGHSGRLLQDVIHQMEVDGCDWSHLFTGVNDHYARYGWVTVDTPNWHGSVRSEASAPIGGQAKVIELGDKYASSLTQVAKVYDAYNANRPLTTIRTPRTWKTATAYRICPEFGTRLLVAKEGATVVAYLALREYDNSATVIEMGCLPGKDLALHQIAEVVRQSLVQKGLLELNANLGDDKQTVAALEVIGTNLKRHTHGAAMVRPIGTQTTLDEIKSWYAATGANHYPLDDF